MTIQFPTETRMDGPWLLEREAFLQLDTIIDDEWSRFEERRNSLVSQKVEEYFQDKRMDDAYSQFTADDWNKEYEIYKSKLLNYNYRRSNREITIYLKSGGTYTAERFSSVFRDNTLLNEVATGFSVDLQSEDIRCRIFTENVFDKNELRINVSPENIPEAREAFTTFSQWAGRYRVPYWQHIWGKIANLNWLYWPLYILIIFIMFYPLFTNSTNYARQQARELLDQGITEQNSTEAIELLLILETNYTSGSKTFTIPSRFLFIFLGGFLLCVAISIRPKIVLGIGRGEILIRRWRLWQRLVGISIPALIFSSFIWPIIVGWINNTK